MTFILDAFFKMIEGLFNLLPDVVEITFIPPLEPLINIMGYGLYFFCDYRFFDIMMVGYVTWTSTHLAFAIIRFIYTKFPGVDG